MGNGCSADKSGTLNLNSKSIPDFKIIFIGERGVGKSNLLRRYVHNQFDYSYRPTQKVVIENVVRKLNVPANCIVSLTLWDVPGHEDMDLRSTYYRNADAVVVAVDLSDEDSLHLAGSWKQDFLNKATRTQDVIETLHNGIQTVKVEPIKGFKPASVPILLLGNKYDLIVEKLAAEKMKLMIDNSMKNVTTRELEFEGMDDLDNILREMEVDEPPVTKTTAGLKNKGKKGKKQEEEEKPDDVIPTDTNEKEEEEKKDTDDGEKKSEEDEDEDKPACVVSMEEIEEEFGFTASIAVSARDKNGSVDAILEALVRHLLGKTTFKNWQKKEKASQKKKRKRKVPINDSFKPLTHVDINELDALFNRCDVAMRRSSDYEKYLEMCERNFKQSCADHGVLRVSKPSLEDAIIALRQFVQNNLARDIQLTSVSWELMKKQIQKQVNGKITSLMTIQQLTTTKRVLLLRVEEDDGFLQLLFEVFDTEEDVILMKQHRPLKLVFDNFNMEFATICKAILRDCPLMDTVLGKLDGRIETQIEQLLQKQSNSSQNDENQSVTPQVSEHVMSVCERNRARIAHSRLVIADCMERVQSAEKKIRAALIWDSVPEFIGLAPELWNGIPGELIVDLNVTGLTFKEMSDSLD